MDIKVLSTIMRAINFKTVQEEVPDTSMGNSTNYGHIVFSDGTTNIKVVYYVDSYGCNLEFESVKKVEPKEVIKVEYV